MRADGSWITVTVADRHLLAPLLRQVQMKETSGTTLMKDVLISITQIVIQVSGSKETQAGTVGIPVGSVTPSYLSTGGPQWDTSGNLELTTASTGVILKSPNGTRYKVTVTNAGNLSVAARDI